MLFLMRIVAELFVAAVFCLVLTVALAGTMDFVPQLAPKGFQSHTSRTICREATKVTLRNPMEMLAMGRGCAAPARVLDEWLLTPCRDGGAHDGRLP